MESNTIYISDLPDYISDIYYDLTCRDEISSRGIIIKPIIHNKIIVLSIYNPLSVNHETEGFHLLYHDSKYILRYFYQDDIYTDEWDYKTKTDISSGIVCTTYDEIIDIIVDRLNITPENDDFYVRWSPHCISDSNNLVEYSDSPNYKVVSSNQYSNLRIYEYYQETSRFSDPIFFILDPNDKKVSSGLAVDYDLTIYYFELLRLSKGGVDKIHFRTLYKLDTEEELHCILSKLIVTNNRFVSTLEDIVSWLKTKKLNEKMSKREENISKS